MRVSLAEIVVDEAIQARVGINQQVVDDYANAMMDGADFPPIVVFRIAEKLVVADGFHRVRAAQKLQLDDIEVEIREGDRRDAVLFGIGANAAHGLQRTHEDKRKSALTLINDSVWGKWSHAEIARRANVSAPFVAKLRESLTQNVYSENASEPQSKAVTGEIASDARAYITKHGTVSVMRTAAIGKRAKQELPKADDPPTVRLSDVKRHIASFQADVRTLPAAPSGDAIPSEPERSEGSGGTVVRFACGEADGRDASGFVPATAVASVCAHNIIEFRKAAPPAALMEPDESDEVDIDSDDYDGQTKEEAELDRIDLSLDENKAMVTYMALLSIASVSVEAKPFWLRMARTDVILQDAKSQLEKADAILAAIKTEIAGAESDGRPAIPYDRAADIATLRGIVSRQSSPNLSETLSTRRDLPNLAEVLREALVYGDREELIEHMKADVARDKEEHQKLLAGMAKEADYY